MPVNILKPVTIESAEITHQDDDNLEISWSGTNGFGRLRLKHTKNGIYELDSEMLGMNTVLLIFQKALENYQSIKK